MTNRITRSTGRTTPRTCYKKFFTTPENHGEIENIDIINPQYKKLFNSMISGIGNDYKQKMYLIEIYVFEDDKFYYKVGFTNHPLAKRLGWLNEKYKSGYQTHLIDWYYISHQLNEKDFHEINVDICAKYRDSFKRLHKELYLNEEIVERFRNYDGNYTIYV